MEAGSDGDSTGHRVFEMQGIRDELCIHLDGTGYFTPAKSTWWETRTMCSHLLPVLQKHGILGTK